ncbi:L-histidine N(alpha)-methyltransferase [uncultured Eudoraea sp.]|uniref:L-histidine N(alpha)-methyltransferase n=1 Tax=uncultured Eudoraea sp. TaxID=1035614 RepID=UPI00260618C1|nr:L-histidine N(alpha)-methyltransferase [uncultured Eudoraea sp.]
MQQKTTLISTSEFHKDVYKGLTDFPKHLSSKYFYDAKGDKLFQEIMDMPEYYLTNSEYQILDKFKDEICRAFFKDSKEFDLIELGAGDGKKTKILLRQLAAEGVPFQYVPIDISENALNQLEESISNELPSVNVKSLQGTYFETLEQLCSMEHKRKVIMFLGSNIGNLLHPQAVEFLTSIQKLMNDDDLLFIGFDQKKDPQTILNAYNDNAGVTERFNKNLLARINSELGANFDLDKFKHWEVYDPETGTAKSYLVSKENQTIHINGLDLTVTFNAWETIHAEISQKYDDNIVAWLADKAGMQISRIFSDENKFYKNYILKK